MRLPWTRGRDTLTHNAAAVIFAHNHPSGVAEPSPADTAMTRHLKNALALVDIRVLGHIIIGDGEHVVSHGGTGVAEKPRLPH